MNGVKNQVKTYIESTALLFKFFIKNYLFSMKIIWLSLIIPFFCIISFLVFTTIGFGFTFAFFISLNTTAFISYGGSALSIKETTIYKNIDLTKNSLATFYLALLLKTLLATFITCFSFMALFIILDKLSVTSHAFFYNQSITQGTSVLNPNINWSQIWWDVIIYYWFSSTILSFSLGFFFSQITKSKKTFYVIVFTYLVIGFVCGGVFSSTVYIQENGLVNIIDSGDQSSIGIPVYYWGTFLWTIGQFFPHFGLNQLIFHAIDSGEYWISNGDTFFNPWNDINIFNAREISEGFYLIYYFLTPWLFVFGSLTIGGIISNHTSK